MKVLVFTKNWIGDVIFAEPLIRLLKKKYPHAEVLCACPPRCIPFLAKNPYVSRCIPFDEKGAERSWYKRIRFIMRLRKERIDSAYIVHRSLSRVVLCACAGIPKRIGYDTKGRGLFLTTKIPFDEDIALQRHDADQFAALAEMSKVPDEEKRYRFYYSDADAEAVTTLLQTLGVANKPFICINPGANWLPKRWFPESYARVIDTVLTQFDGVILITGSEDDGPLFDAVVQSMRGDVTRVYNVCGQTTLTEVGSLFSRAKCVVTADSGPMHIAVGVGASVVALFGPTNYIRTGPFGVGKATVLVKRVDGFTIPCFDDSRATECMRNITPEMVCDAVHAYIR